MKKNIRRRLIIITLVHLLALATSVHAIMHTRTAQGTIGWVIALNALPWVSLPAYWVFGNDHFEDHVVARRKGNERMIPVTETALANTAEFAIAGDEVDDTVQTLHTLATLPVLGGNDVELLADGESTFESLLSGISAAESYILMQWYIVRDDDIGTRVRQALAEKAREGVSIYFLYDAFGSIKLDNDYIKTMEDAGIHARAFRAADTLTSRFQVNFRNHRKITVVDGRTAWIGGNNLADEYLGRHERLTPWRDAHVKLKGPAALMAQLAFASDWNFTAGEVPALSWMPVAAETADEAALIVPSGPADDLEVTKLMFVNAINDARERVWIASPYYVPDEAVISALQLAGLRGVDVRILIPKLNDHLLVKWTAWSYFAAGAETGVKFYWYEDGFMHRKAMLVDDDIAVVGSANFDNRSFRLNFEISGVFMSEDMVGQVQDMFETDFARSEPVEADAIKSKPFWFRFAVNAARLAAPVL